VDEELVVRESAPVGRRAGGRYSSPVVDGQPGRMMRPGDDTRSANGWIGEVMPALAIVSRSTDHDADDLDLVAGVRAGDDRAFEMLYLRYQGRITAYVRGMVHDHGRAEDITQEVFMSALRRMRANDAAIAFKPWIYEIAKNACIDAWRRSRTTNEVSFDAQDALGADEHGRLADPGVTPDSAVDNKDAIEHLCGAFGGLSQTHHEILVMREFEGLSYREIGERLGMSRPGVESTLFRARRRLSEEYEELVSGERCRRVQRIVDSPSGRAAGVRDQRRMARHLSHCQPCRRYARLVGADLETPARPAAAAKIAAWFPLPLPLYLRRRWEGEEAGQLVAQSSHGPVAQWSASLAGVLDPSIVSGWSKAIATAATVALAGVGAGAAIREHKAIERFVGASPSTASHAAPRAAATRSAAQHSKQAARGHRAPAAATPASGAAPGPRAAELAPAAAASHENAASGAPATGTAKLGPDDRESAAKGPGALTALTEDTVAAAPGTTSTLAPVQPLDHALDVLGAPAGAAGTTGDPAGAGTGSTAGAAPPVEQTVGTASDVVSGATGPPPAQVALTDLIATVSTTVPSPLDTTVPGRTAP
jgi:RNA polymerase sigma factor (sigma-70 family)